METRCASETVGWPAGIVRRVRGALVCGLAIAGIVLAARLHPDPVGAGTHTQLHMPSCSILNRTGWPCPTCGITTSLSAMARGDIGLALRAQSFGVVLFLALAASALAGGVMMLSGRPMLAALRPRAWWVLVAGVGLLLGWAVKLSVGVASGELPIR